MPDEPERRPYNVGVVKLPYADRDVAHAVITEDDDRGFFDIIGADTPDDDPTFPVGSRTTYRVELTDEEAEQFRQASNVRYVELDQIATADGDVQFPSTSTMQFMQAVFPEVGTRWHGRDVSVAILDSGVSQPVINYMGWTRLAKSTFMSGALGSDGTTTAHGSLVAVCGVPQGGLLVDGVIANPDGTAAYSAMVAGMRWAADWGVEVINLSYSGSSNSSVLPDGLDYLQARGVQIFCSAGNDNVSTLYYPAALSPSYTCVHSSISWDTATNLRSTFSNFNAIYSGCAPGTLVLGMDRDGTPTQWSGTSASSPHMALLCARMSTGGRYTPAQAGAALKANTRNLGQPASEQGGGAYDMHAALNALGAFSAGATRTNLAINPACAVNATGWAGSGTSGQVLNLGTGWPRPTGFGGTTDVTTARWPVTAGQAYTTSAYVQTAAATTVSVSIDWRNAAATLLSTSTAKSYTVQAGGAQRVFTTATAPTNAATGSMSIDPASNTTACVVTAHLAEAGSVLGPYFDGASTNGAWTGTAGNSASTRAFPLPPVAVRKNLSPNPSVETVSTGYSLATRAGVTTAAIGQASGVAAASGTFYAFANVTGDGTTSPVADLEITTPTVPVLAGAAYTFSINARHQVTGADAQLHVTWLNATGATLSTTTSNRSPLFTYGWVRYALTATAPAGAVSAVARLLCHGFVEASVRSIRWDALMVEQAAVVGDYFDGDSEAAVWDGTANASTSTYGAQVSVIVDPLRQTRAFLVLI